MQAGILCFILAAVPLLRLYPLWIPLVLATLHFQWFYFYLQYRQVFLLDAFFFAVPLTTDFLFLCFCFLRRGKIWNLIRSSL